MLPGSSNVTDTRGGKRNSYDPSSFRIGAGRGRADVDIEGREGEIEGLVARVDTPSEISVEEWW